MITKDCVMDILFYHRQGLSFRQIAKKLNISRNTVAKYVAHPELLGVRKSAPRKSKLDPFVNAINTYLEEDMNLRATWIYDRLVKMGYSGSYDLVKRKVRELKKEKNQKAYIRFETEPGRQAQVDFGEFIVEYDDGRRKKFYLFTMILGYSRKMYGELVETCDLPHFLECHIHAFSWFGGVPQEILYDRMKNVFTGYVNGMKQFNKTFTGFALHYGFKPTVAPAVSPWVKGKIEQPYSFIREGFWRGYSFTTLSRANDDLLQWLKDKELRIHGTTRQRVSDRFECERPFLTPLPPMAFDTSYRCYRKVHKDCTISFEGNYYVVPHHYVGKSVVVRSKDEYLRIFHNATFLVTYAIPSGKGHLVCNPRFYQDLLNDKEMNARKYSSRPCKKGRAKGTISPSRPKYEMDVAVHSLTVYENQVPQAGIAWR